MSEKLKPQRLFLTPLEVHLHEFYSEVLDPVIESAANREGLPIEEFIGKLECFTKPSPSGYKERYSYLGKLIIEISTSFTSNNGQLDVKHDVTKEIDNAKESNEESNEEESN